MAATGVVLILAAGADWEPAVLALIDLRRDLAVLRRCMDVDELLAAAAAGQADSAVVSTDAPGLDARVVEQLHRHGIRLVAVLPAGAGEEHARVRAVRAGIPHMIGQGALDSLPATLLAEAATPAPEPPRRPTGTDSAPEVADRSTPGTVLTVWGPAGAPGRSTLAAAVAAELARRGQRTLLVDADPYGGCLAQQLGVLDEVSGLLAAARLTSSTGPAHALPPASAHGAPADDDARLAAVVRALHPHLGVVTGLPRAERWVEARGETVTQIAAAATRRGHVVVDAGFSLEDDGLDARPGRNQLTLAALQVADEVLAVGTADPIGLARLMRGLADLRERDPAVVLRVVVNRMRPTLRVQERDVADLIAGVVGSVPVHFLPDDRSTVDKALVTGRTLLETASDGPLPRAVIGLVDGVLGAAPEAKGAVSARAARAARAAGSVWSARAGARGGRCLRRRRADRARRR